MRRMRDTINHRIHGCRGETQFSSAVTGVASHFGGTIRAKIQGAAGQLHRSGHTPRNRWVSGSIDGFPDRWKPIASDLFDGWLGVTVFFVLSGFLITFPLVTEEGAAGRISLRVFYARRALRIQPVDAAYVAAPVMRRFRPALLRGLAVALMWMLMVVGHVASGAISPVASSGTATALAAARWRCPSFLSARGFVR